MVSPTETTAPADPIRACLGTTAHLCEVVVLTLRTALISADIEHTCVIQLVIASPCRSRKRREIAKQRKTRLNSTGRTCYAVCHILYPVSVAHTSILRMDSNPTSDHLISSQARPLARTITRWALQIEPVIVVALRIVQNKDILSSDFLTRLLVEMRFESHCMGTHQLRSAMGL